MVKAWDMTTKCYEVFGGTSVSEQNGIQFFYHPNKNRRYAAHSIVMDYNEDAFAKRAFAKGAFAKGAFNPL